MLWSSLPLPASFPARTCPGHPACPNTYINKETRKPCHVINMLTDEVRAAWQGCARSRRAAHTSAPQPLLRQAREAS